MILCVRGSAGGVDVCVVACVCLGVSVRVCCGCVKGSECGCVSGCFLFRLDPSCFVCFGSFGNGAWVVEGSAWIPLVS